MGTRMLGDLSEHLGDMYGIQSCKGNGCGSDKGSGVSPQESQAQGTGVPG